MRYWDSSALLPLLVGEPATALRRRQLQEDPEVVTWGATRVECASALNRLLREGLLDDGAFEDSTAGLQLLASSWTEVLPSERLRQRAMRLMRLHPLRAADALQLAAALVGAAEDPASLGFACADPRLNEAARKEGFRILP